MIDRLKFGWFAALYLLLDTLCVGAGMGVPFFAILFGFVAGWFLAGWILARTRAARPVLRRILIGALLAAAVTLVGMAVIWARTAAMLFDPAADLANWGLPMILYEPRASFVGWLVLMIVISPALQALTALCGAHLRLLWWLRRGGTFA